MSAPFGLDRSDDQHIGAAAGGIIAAIITAKFA
jgi:hypothetical protein